METEINYNSSTEEFLIESPVINKRNIYVQTRLDNYIVKTKEDESEIIEMASTESLLCQLSYVMCKECTERTI